MRRNCGLQLRLPSFSTSFSSRECHQNSSLDPSSVNPEEIVIFDNGKLCICDVKELQARAIIWLASREMEEKINAKPLHSVALCSPSGLSMKRSLQGFLQKRKKRSKATSPYSPSN